MKIRGGAPGIARLIRCAFAVLVAGSMFVSDAAYSGECAGTAVDVCFRPGEGSCADRIVAAVNRASHSLLVQAYGFTAPQIVQAIGAAHQRGLPVRVILDKENRQPRYTAATYLLNAGVSVAFDDRVAIAHNKIIVIDGEVVIGGSYNYTRAAEARNAENVTFSRSGCLAGVYTSYFESRWKASHIATARN